MDELLTNMDESLTIEIEYLVVDPSTFTQMMIAEGLYDMTAVKWKALEKLEVPIVPNLKPLQCWLKNLHERNNLPYTQPAHPAIVDAILSNDNGRRFLWWLA